jgi:arylsulfatase A-like enzyme
MKPLVMFDGEGGSPLTEGPVDFPKLTERFFARTLAFAEANRERPFFVLLALTAPHVPLDPNPDDLTGSPAGAYGEVVEEIDLNMGRLFAGLDRLGLEQDTLVVFTSDNGPWFEGSSGPFRDRKGGSAFDGGFRVPFLLRQPGTVPAGAVRTGIASNLDLLPTLCRMAGVFPPEVELDGRDLTDMILSDVPSPNEEVVLFDNAKVAAVRTDRWKYVVRSYYRTFDVPLDRFGYPLLFDMRADPGESYGLARLHPEVAAEMKARVERARVKYEPIAAQFPPYVPPRSAAKHPD